MRSFETIIIGGGQAGLAVAFYLRRHQIKFVILDDQSEPGGAWLNTWDSLKLFSPTTFSGLPGWKMPPSKDEYPTKNEFISYLKAYEKRYSFLIKRQSKVTKVSKSDGGFHVYVGDTVYDAKTVVSCTGTAQKPFIPPYKNQSSFKGLQLHSVDYKQPNLWKDKQVMVIGAGNSAAQILAEVSKVTLNTTWVTRRTPEFLPKDIDGRYLFLKATETFYLKSNSQTRFGQESFSVNQIVQIKEVVKARDRKVYKDKRPFIEFTETGVIWPDGRKQTIDVVIWCTGFKANLTHLESLQLQTNSRIKVQGTQSIKEPKLWLVGYGNWTGYASATIYGVGKTAKQTALEVKYALTEI